MSKTSKVSVWMTLAAVALAFALPVSSVLAQKGGGKGGGGGGSDPPVNVPTYSITFANTLGGLGVSATDYWSRPGFNNLGDVVGVTGFDNASQRYPFLFTAAGGVVNANSLIDPASGWTISRVYDINDSRTIVGAARRDLDGDGRLDPGVPIRLLPPSPGGLYWNIEQLSTSPGTAFAINNSGDIAGLSNLPTLWLWNASDGITPITAAYPNGYTTSYLIGVLELSERDPEGELFVGVSGGRVVEINGSVNEWGVAFLYSTRTDAYTALRTYASGGTGNSYLGGINNLGDFGGSANKLIKGRYVNTASLYVQGMGQLDIGSLISGRNIGDSHVYDLDDTGLAIGSYWADNVSLPFIYGPEFGVKNLRSQITNLSSSYSGTLTPILLNDLGEIWGVTSDNQMFFLVPNGEDP